MTERELRDWLVAAAPRLADAGIDAIHGAGPRLTADGASWISFSSRWGSGRLVREADGSSHMTGHRYALGATPIDSRSATTTTEQLESLASALGRASG